MIIPLLCCLASAAPVLASGPELLEKAVDTDLPIREVTVFSDRARVHRAGRSKLGSGIHALRLPDLPGAVLPDSVQVRALRAKILRVEVSRVERTRLSIEHVEALLVKLEQKADAIALIDGKSRILASEFNFLNNAVPKNAVEEMHRDGKSLPVANVDSWRAVLDFLQQRRQQLQSELRVLQHERRKLAQEFELQQRELERFNLGAWSEQRLQVYAIVMLDSTQIVDVGLDYFIPGAFWKPAYDLHLSPRDGKVTLQTLGLVQQATGEDWQQAKLALSTAIPGQSIALPELLTWTLGERRDFTPQPRPESTPVVGQRFAPPTPLPSKRDANDALRQLYERLSMLREIVANDTGGEFDEDVASALGSTRDEKKEKRKRESVRRPSVEQPPPAGYLSGTGEAPPAPPMQKPQPSVMRVQEPAPASATAASDNRGFNPFGGLVNSVSDSRQQERVSSSSMALFDSNMWYRPRFSDASLPAALAGGFDYVYHAPTLTSVPSDGQSLRVPLASKTFNATLRYQVTPALSTTAYLTASVENQDRLPLLQGPANIFVGDTFTGEGQLDTTGPGGTLVLPLGADENIRVVHHVAAETRSDGLIIKDDVTVYAATIEIGNYKDQSIDIDVFDVLPKTNNPKIEIKLLSSQPKLASKVSAKGRLRWRVKIAPQKTAKIIFRYSIRRPLNWQLIQ